MVRITYSELLVAFDELIAEAGLADVKCDGRDQTTKLRAYKKSK